MKDNAGTVIEVGDYVAYNWSGQLAAGYIVSIGSKGKWNRRNYRIQQIVPGRQDSLSLVKDSRSVLVLQKGVDA